MTILIIGGAYQGKLAYAQGLPQYGGETLDGANADEAAFSNAACVNHLHLFVQKLLREGVPPEAVQDLITQNTADKIILCDDICGGIVPMDKAEILWRETTGRLLCDLTKCADVVVRMQCGLPQAWKGAL